MVEFDQDKNNTLQLESQGDEYMGIEIVALDDASFQKYAEKIGADYEKIKKSGVLCDDYEYLEEGNTSTKVVRKYTYQENEKITGTYQGRQISIPVGKISNIRPFGMETYYWEGGYLVVNEAEYKQLGLGMKTITIQAEKPQEVVTRISDLYEALDVVNLEEEVKKENAMVLVINIFLYGFISVITLIGVTNIFNTITSNMELRQKEFAMLKSIGMTKKEFNGMIHLETIFYSCKALFYGVLLGLLGTYAVNKSISIKLDTGIYFPNIPILLSIVFVFIIVFLIMRYSVSKMNKQNTIETIRKENV